MLIKGSYWPGGGSAFTTDGLGSAEDGAEGAGVEGACAEALSGTSTVFQSSSASTVRAIRVPTLISFVPSGT